MDTQNKCCGNCNSFIPSIDGFGACTEPSYIYGVHCNNDACSLFKMKSNNGWTEITPDNVDEVRKTDVGRLMIAVITHGEPYYMEYREMFRELDEMAILGGYYFFVLPELKIE